MIVNAIIAEILICNFFIFYLFIVSLSLLGFWLPLYLKLFEVLFISDQTKSTFNYDLNLVMVANVSIYWLQK
jgi:hypothetical protein